MRILCLNGNTTQAITTRVGDEMRLTLGQTATVVDCTPASGPAIIMNRADVALAANGIFEAAVGRAPVDAIMLAVSFDTARDQLREALDIPVIGMTEASVALARMRGSRIGYVSIGTDLTPLYHETLTHCHLQADMAAWEAIHAPSAYKPGDSSEADAITMDACNKLVTAGADVIVLLGAVMAGAARRVQVKLPIPIIDGGTAGALVARAAVDLVKQTA